MCYQSRQRPATGVHDDIYGRAVLLEVDGRVLDPENTLLTADYAGAVCEERIELKTHSQAKCCIICGYTNGYKSYILQPELYEDSARCRASKYRACDVRGYIDSVKEHT